MRAESCGWSCLWDYTFWDFKMKETWTKGKLINNPWSTKEKQKDIYLKNINYEFILSLWDLTYVSENMWICFKMQVNALFGILAEKMGSTLYI